jgi:fumarylacetoacetase
MVRAAVELTSLRPAPTEAAAVVECYPYGLFVDDARGEPHLGLRVGEALLDLHEAAGRHSSSHRELLTAPSLDPLLAAGPEVWRDVHAEAVAWAAQEALLPRSGLEMLLPFTVADYVDFYASEAHATNLGRMLRPGQPPLPANWRHQPVGYHGRSGTVVVSGTPVVRPRGHVAVEAGVELRATARLDVEVEVGFVVGVPSERGTPVPLSAFADHVFGVVVVNDWSARDIQAWESAPLGPFLGKSFQTSVSPWVVPLTALEPTRVPAASAGTAVSDYLLESEPWGLDLALELAVDGEVVSRPPYRTMHWSPAQMLAHLTVNGASLRTGDLFASGTVSGGAADEVGSLIERWGGSRFLEDDSEVVISATAPAASGARLDLGEVRGRVVAAPD